MSPLSLSRKSLIGRLMLAFSLLALLLLLLVSLGSLGLYWVKLADKYLYEDVLPASEAARQLVQSSNALADNAQQLGRIEEEAQRQFVGRKLSINSASMLGAIASLKQLQVQTDLSLEKSAGEIIRQLSGLGERVGQRLAVASQLRHQGLALVTAAGATTELLQAELAVVDSAILSKLSLAYPQVVGAEKTSELLDDVIEQDLDTQERLNRAIKIVHNIALMGQIFQSPEQESGVLRLITSQSVPQDNSQAETLLTSLGVNLMALEYLADIIRDPVRAKAFQKELQVFELLKQSVHLQGQYTRHFQAQELQLEAISNRLDALNGSVDAAMKSQQQLAKLARADYLRQLAWAKLGLWATGILMLVVIFIVVYRVIYQGIAVRLNEATSALAQLSLGNTQVSINTHGDDELAAMASAIKAFKQKTAHNQKLQTALRETACELTEHKQALEIKVEERTQELAETNKRLDEEARGHVIARDIAEQANQAKSLFLATMSHEIRTPLNGLLGTLTLLGHSNLPTAQKQMLALSQYSGTLLQTVLNDILDFSRLEQGKLTNEPRPVSIQELIDEVIAIMLAGAGLAGLRLVLDCPRLPTWVNIDGPKLRQVLFNLLGNAIKFTPSGEVRLKVYSRDNRLFFEVHDSGLGINEEAMKQLFKAYCAQPTQGRARGTGLGLAISKQLVELMNEGQAGGQTGHGPEPSLWVRSVEGKGSCFGFDLPLQICNGADISVDEKPPQVESKRVLLVEDNKVNAMVAQGFLAHLGHESELAGSCAEARSLYRLDTAKQFDAIMLDIQLGDGSGFELLKELNVIDAQAKHSPVIAAFTAQVQADDIAHYRAEGFDTVLAKPLSMQSLAAWLGAVSLGSGPGQHRSASWPAQEGVFEARPAHDGALSDADERHGVEDLLDLSHINQDLTYLGLEAVQDMLSLYLDSSERHLQALSRLAGDTDTLLHALKGSSASMGLRALASLCRSLESAPYSQASHSALVALWQDSIAALKKRLGREQT